MRILRVLMTALAVLALAAAPASAAPPSHSVTGAGTRLSDLLVKFSVDAHTTLGGASGSYSFNRLEFPLRISGPVTCLNVDGNQAAVGGVITRVFGGDDFANLGDSFLVFFIDNGTPQGGPFGPDVVSQTYIFPLQTGEVEVPSDFPTTCPPAAEDHDAFDVIGNFVVK